MSSASTARGVRPHVLLLSEITPFPSPLTGAQLRVARVLDAFVESFDVTFAHSMPAELADSALNWPMRSRLAAQIAIPRQPRNPKALWGGPISMLDALRPRTVPKYIAEQVPRELELALRSLQCAETVDVVWASRTWMAELAHVCGFRNIVVDVDDFESHRLTQEIERRAPYARESFHRSLARRVERYEFGLPERFPSVVVTKEEDRSLLDQNTKGRIVCVGNGVDIPDSIDTDREQENAVLFVGTLNYAPNIDALEWLIQEILPAAQSACPGLTLTVAGRGKLPEALQTKIDQCEWIRLCESPIDLAPLYAAAATVVAPIRTGHGTKIKVLEALAFGKALVATRESTRGFDLIDGKHVLMADDAESFRSSILSLLGNRAQRGRLGSVGRAHVQKSFAWTATTSAAVAEVQYLADSKGAL